jgi:glyoxylase-like metal-dependent hydrolase (beta-lactamase superfamily II)
VTIAAPLTVAGKGDDMTRIHTHASGEGGIFSNAYAVETEHGIVAIDATLSVSESRAFRGELDRIGKPLLAVLVTHAHPDHVAGIGEVVRGRDVPVLALPAVAEMMREIEEPKRRQWQPVFKDEWIPAWTHPNRLVRDGEVVALDGVRFRVHDMGGGGDCRANAIWVIEDAPRAAFIGDLVFHGTHSYIADGQLAEWLANLDRARSLLDGVATIHPGHGPGGSLELLDRQRRYLEAYRDAVQEIAQGRPSLTDGEKTELTARMERAFPSAGLAFLVALSADAVAGELARAAAGASYEATADAHGAGPPA